MTRQEYLKAYRKRYYAEHREQELETARQYRRKHYAEMSEKARADYELHKEERKAYSRWYAYKQKPDADPSHAARLYDEYLSEKAKSKIV